MSSTENIDNLLARLRRERERDGLTQADIAERMGVSQSVVSEIERASYDMRVSTLQRYHRAVTGESLRLELRHRVLPHDPAPKRTDFAISA